MPELTLKIDASELDAVLRDLVVELQDEIIELEIGRDYWRKAYWKLFNRVHELTNLPVDAEE